MAKLKCLCGVQLSNSSSPNQAEGLILTDEQLSNGCEIGSLDAMSMGRDVWECYNCGRLAINYPTKHDATVKWYKPEDGVPGKIMAFNQLDQKE